MSNQKNPCHLSNQRKKGIKCQNHRLYGFKDYTDLKSLNQKNPCYLSNPRKSVIQTTNLQKVKIDE